MIASTGTRRIDEPGGGTGGGSGGSDLLGRGARGLAIGIGGLMVGAGVVVLTIAARAADGRIGRNGLAGIRTRAIMSSDEARSEAHRAGARRTRIGGLLSVAAGVVPVIGNRAARSWSES